MSSATTKDWMRRMPLSPVDNGQRRGKLRAVKSLDLEAFRAPRPVSKAQTVPALRTAKSMAFDEWGVGLGLQLGEDDAVYPEDCESEASDASDGLSLSPPLHVDPSPTRSPTRSREPREPKKGEQAPASHNISRRSLPNTSTSSAPVPYTPHHARTRSNAEGHRRALSRITHIGQVPDLHKTPERTPLNSPKVDQLCIFTAQDACDATASFFDESASYGSLQDILSVLAQKERRVLEAEDALQVAHAELRVFRDNLRHLMDPSQTMMPIGVMCTTPRIISRAFTPNLGINGLHIVPVATSSVYEISLDEHTETIAFRFVHSLLDLVHCIISIFPRRGGQDLARVEWSREYLSPCGLLYGMEL